MTFLERARPLQDLRASLDRTSAGHGEIVFLGGEAGIGKSTLIEHHLREAKEAHHSVVVSCDGSVIPGPFGPLVDLSEGLGLDTNRWLESGAARDEIYREVLQAFRAVPGPTILVGEDAHWIDEATLELIRFLGRRIDGSKVQFIVAYRNDELEPYHPLRRVLGDLVNSPSVRRIDLEPLSRDAVRELALSSGIDADALYQRTGGNPFFVTETIASGTTDVPETVRDAVLARAARLSPEARAVIDTAAVLSSPIDLRLLEKIIGARVAELVDACLAAGMLRDTDGLITFRHAISRDAILSSISAPRLRALHQRVLDAMREDPAQVTRLDQLAYHAEAAGNEEATLEFAPAAARHAAAFGAHREAADHYRRALRFAAHLPDTERRALLEAEAVERYLTGDIDEAIRLQRDAVSLSTALGDTLRQGDSTRWLSRFLWFSGQTAEAREHAESARALLETLPPGPELGMAWSNLSQLHMLAGEFDKAIEWGTQAITLATELDNPAILAHAMTNVGSSRTNRGEEDGVAMLEEAARLAREHGLEDDAVRAMTNLGYGLLTQHDLPRAERALDEGIAYAEERDLLAMELYQRANRASVWLARGRWEDARSEATTITQLPAAIAGTRIVALICLGRVCTILGEEAGSELEEAHALASQTGELQRLGPTTSARAEAAWLHGTLERLRDEIEPVWRLAVGRADRWLEGELGLWLHRAGVKVSIEGLPEPYALEISGDAAAASRAWSELGHPLEAARARASSGTEEDLRAALEQCDRIGARADALRITRHLRAIGVRKIPRGPRASTRANAGQLTARELEVLRLVAERASNREIAERLFLSPKTGGHHVSSILAKLDVGTREEAARYATSTGMLQIRDQEPER